MSSRINTITESCMVVRRCRLRFNCALFCLTAFFCHFGVGASIGRTRPPCGARVHSGRSVPRRSSAPPMRRNTPRSVIVALRALSVGPCRMSGAPEVPHHSAGVDGLWQMAKDISVDNLRVFTSVGKPLRADWSSPEAWTPGEQLAPALQVRLGGSGGGAARALLASCSCGRLRPSALRGPPRPTRACGRSPAHTLAHPAMTGSSHARRSQTPRHSVPWPPPLPLRPRLSAGRDGLSCDLMASPWAACCDHMSHVELGPHANGLPPSTCLASAPTLRPRLGEMVQAPWKTPRHWLGKRSRGLRKRSLGLRKRSIGLHSARQSHAHAAPGVALQAWLSQTLQCPSSRVGQHGDR